MQDSQGVDPRKPFTAMSFRERDLKQGRRLLLSNRYAHAHTQLSVIRIFTLRLCCVTFSCAKLCKAYSCEKAQ